MKNRNFIISIAVVLTTVFFLGCYYDNEEELYPSLPDKNCDTVNITYNTHIQKILSAHCLSCHGEEVYAVSGGSVNLGVYQSVKIWIDFIIPSIEHTSSRPMPKNSAKLSDCMINQFKIWKQNGTPLE